MKKKTLEKKLILKKETLSNLENKQMNDARGGATANTCYRSCLICPTMPPMTC
jgi:hypothetical protein